MITEYQTIQGNVPSKSNSYKIISINGHASLAKQKALKEYEDKFYIQCNKYRNANILGYFELHLKVFYPSERSDLDNSLKIILDWPAKDKGHTKRQQMCKNRSGKVFGQREAENRVYY